MADGGGKGSATYTKRVGDWGYLTVCSVKNFLFQRGLVECLKQLLDPKGRVSGWGDLTFYEQSISHEPFPA